MPIWVYQDWSFGSHTKELSIEGLRQFSSQACPYCSRSTYLLRSERPIGLCRQGYDIARELRACNDCGWWAINENAVGHWMEDSAYHYGTAAAVMKGFKLNDLSLPIADLRKHLVTHYEDRLDLHPGKCQELVADVFRADGKRVRTGGRSVFTPDGGIDLFVLDGNDACEAGIQVKRYRSKIEVHQIREFAGALVLQGLTKGVFVTTSEFTWGAQAAATGYEERGIAIQLVDAYGFYDRIEIQQRAEYLSADDRSAQFSSLLDRDDLFPGADSHYVDDG